MAKSPQYTIHISSHFALPLQLLCNTKTWDVSCAFNDISLVKVDECSDTVCSIIVEARGAGEGFCFKKISKKTGACKKISGKKIQKVDCCSGGGAGWSKRKKDKDSCEPCRTSVQGRKFGP